MANSDVRNLAAITGQAEDDVINVLKQHGGDLEAATNALLDSECPGYIDEPPRVYRHNAGYTLLPKNSGEKSSCRATDCRKMLLVLGKTRAPGNPQLTPLSPPLSSRSGKVRGGEQGEEEKGGEWGIRASDRSRFTTHTGVAGKLRFDRKAPNSLLPSRLPS
jgi:hypothetical protein